MSGLVLTELWRYPVKSLRGNRHEALPVGARGLVADRHWMLVGNDGRFLTQRQLPRMALINTRLETGFGSHELWLSLDTGEECRVVSGTDGEPLEVTLWGDTCEARTVASEVDRWLSDFLETPCRLVELPLGNVRAVDPEYAAPGADDQVGFADGFPFLLISQASLDGLNERLDAPLPMQRFRPNLVISGCEPHAEDHWKHIRIGEISFRVAKPCSRCPIPTIDPMTGERGAEPLRTLQSYRFWNNRVWFGQNLLHDATGELREGMPVEVLD